jgi:glycine betaine/choline ABC-type transport system substrate-binding protein
VNGALTTTDLQQLNKRISVDKDEPDALAAQWVKDHIRQ